MIGRLVVVGDNGIFASGASGRYSLTFTRPDTPRGLSGGTVSGDLVPDWLPLARAIVAEALATGAELSPDWALLAHAILAEAEIIQREKDQ